LRHVAKLHNVQLAMCLEPKKQLPDIKFFFKAKQIAVANITKILQLWLKMNDFLCLAFIVHKIFKYEELSWGR
jgi:hypothetical protein